jgi:hypothetical protein
MTRPHRTNLTRKQFLRLAALAAGTAAAGTVAGTAFAGAPAATDGGDLQPVDPTRAVLRALDRYPLVGLGDAHMCEQSHTLLRSLIQRPDVQCLVDDVVVEFGNALYQDIADRFLLDLQPVGFDELSQMWRNTLGGRVYWDAPVYEQFYRTVRAVNESLPRHRRIRVILGDVPVDWDRVRTVADADQIPSGDQRETYYAGAVEREVLARGHRALLVIGGGHLRRGCHTTTTDDIAPPKNPNQATAGTLLTARHPGSLYIFEPFAAINSFSRSMPDGVPERAEQTMTPWPVPSVAALAGTWLGTQPMPLRAFDPNSAYQDQIDALLWVGVDDNQTCARADPEIYRTGWYATELRRRSDVLTAIRGTTIDLVAEGLRLAGLGPSCSER